MPDLFAHSGQASPFNIKIMDVESFIKEQNIQRVSSTLIKEPSSIEFHPQGLFSESIFGREGTPERMTSFGYIHLNTKIIAPIVYQTIIKMGALYKEIMSGQTYAHFNEQTGDFERVYGDPEDSVGCETGFSFFLRCYPRIKFKNTESISRETRISLVDMYRDISLYEDYIVEPAGLRDISVDLSGRMIQDDINRLYTTLMMLTMSIPPGSDSLLYDGIRFNIQAKCIEIYEYIDNMITGKRGFLAGVYAHRKVAMGVRNVISAASYSTARPDHPQTLRPDETILGLYLAMKGAQPIVFHYLKTLLMDPIFTTNGSTYSIPLINKKTYQLEYQEISDETRQKFTSSDGVNGWINRFMNIDVRNKPITVNNQNNQSFYLCLVYDDEDQIILFRSIDDLKAALPYVDRHKIRPLTWAEAFYMVTYQATADRHVFITRYPVLGDGSCYPSRIHLASTVPARVVELIDLLDPSHPRMLYPEYPVLGQPYQETVSVHSSRLAGLGGDQWSAM